MKKIIEMLQSTIEKGGCSTELNRTFELLIKARTIEILNKQASDGVGFAIEAISRIAASASPPFYLSSLPQSDTDE